MKVCALSDTHGVDPMVFLQDNPPPPDCKVLIHAGDFTGGQVDRTRRVRIGKAHRESFDDFVTEILHVRKTYGFEHIIVVPGNHDQMCYVEEMKCKKRFNEHGIDFLVDESVTIRDPETDQEIKFYGTPWTKEFLNWFFMLEEDGLKRVFQHIPTDTDVLISHGPPYRILDHTINGRNEGSKSLLSVLQNRPWDIKVCIFGHIHEEGGQNRRHEGAWCANVSVAQAGAYGIQYIDV